MGKSRKKLEDAQCSPFGKSLLPCQRRELAVEVKKLTSGQINGHNTFVTKKRQTARKSFQHAFGSPRSSCFVARNIFDSLSSDFFDSSFTKVEDTKSITSTSSVSPCPKDCSICTFEHKHTHDQFIQVDPLHLPDKSLLDEVSHDRSEQIRDLLQLSVCDTLTSKPNDIDISRFGAKAIPLLSPVKANVLAATSIDENNFASNFLHKKPSQSNISSNSETISSRDNLLDKVSCTETETAVNFEACDVFNVQSKNNEIVDASQHDVSDVPVIDGPYDVSDVPVIDGPYPLEPCVTNHAAVEVSVENSLADKLAHVPDIDEIDGVNFLSFATEKALKEFVAKNNFTRNKTKRKPRRPNILTLQAHRRKIMQQRYKNIYYKKLQSKSCSVSSYLKKRKSASRKVKPKKRIRVIPKYESDLHGILPTKTADVTQIKGWKRKTFLPAVCIPKIGITPTTNEKIPATNGKAIDEVEESNTSPFNSEFEEYVREEVDEGLGEEEFAIKLELQQQSIREGNMVPSENVLKESESFQQLHLSRDDDSTLPENSHMIRESTVHQAECLAVNTNNEADTVSAEQETLPKVISVCGSSSSDAIFESSLLEDCLQNEMHYIASNQMPANRMSALDRLMKKFDMGSKEEKAQNTTKIEKLENDPNKTTKTINKKRSYGSNRKEIKLTSTESVIADPNAGVEWKSRIGCGLKKSKKPKTKKELMDKAKQNFKSADANKRIICNKWAHPLKLKTIGMKEAVAAVDVLQVPANIIDKRLPSPVEILPESGITCTESFTLPYCCLGCVCESIKQAGRQRTRSHCGNVDCMFGCTCGHGASEEGIKRRKLFDSSSMSIPDPDPPLKLTVGRRKIRQPERLKDNAWHFLENKITSDKLLHTTSKSLKTTEKSQHLMSKKFNQESMVYNKGIVTSAKVFAKHAAKFEAKKDLMHVELARVKPIALSNSKVPPKIFQPLDPEDILYGYDGASCRTKIWDNKYKVFRSPVEIGKLDVKEDSCSKQQSDSLDIANNDNTCTESDTQSGHLEEGIVSPDSVQNVLKTEEDALFEKDTSIYKTSLSIANFIMSQFSGTLEKSTFNALLYVIKQNLKEMNTDTFEMKDVLPLFVSKLKEEKLIENSCCKQSAPAEEAFIQGSTKEEDIHTLNTKDYKQETFVENQTKEIPLANTDYKSSASQSVSRRKSLSTERKFCNFPLSPPTNLNRSELSGFHNTKRSRKIKSFSMASSFRPSKKQSSVKLAYDKGKIIKPSTLNGSSSGVLTASKLLFGPGGLAAGGRLPPVNSEASNATFAHSNKPDELLEKNDPCFKMDKVTVPGDSDTEEQLLFELAKLPAVNAEPAPIDLSEATACVMPSVDKKPLMGSTSAMQEMVIKANSILSSCLATEVCDKDESLMSTPAAPVIAISVPSTNIPASGTSESITCRVATSSTQHLSSSGITQPDTANTIGNTTTCTTITNTVSQIIDRSLTQGSVGAMPGIPTTIPLETKTTPLLSLPPNIKFADNIKLLIPTKVFSQHIQSASKKFSQPEKPNESASSHIVPTSLRLPLQAVVPQGHPLLIPVAPRMDCEHKTQNRTNINVGSTTKAKLNKHDCGLVNTITITPMATVAQPTSAQKVTQPVKRGVITPALPLLQLIPVASVNKTLSTSTNVVDSQVTSQSMCIPEPLSLQKKLSIADTSRSISMDTKGNFSKEDLTEHRNLIIPRNPYRTPSPPVPCCNVELPFRLKMKELMQHSLEEDQDTVLSDGGNYSTAENTPVSNVLLDVADNRHPDAINEEDSSTIGSATEKNDFQTKVRTTFPENSMSRWLSDSDHTYISSSSISKTVGYSSISNLEKQMPNLQSTSDILSEQNSIFEDMVVTNLSTSNPFSELKDSGPREEYNDLGSSEFKNNSLVNNAFSDKKLKEIDLFEGLSTRIVTRSPVSQLRNASPLGECDDLDSTYTNSPAITEPVTPSGTFRDKTSLSDLNVDLAVQKAASQANAYTSCNENIGISSSEYKIDNYENEDINSPLNFSSKSERSDRLLTNMSMHSPTLPQLDIDDVDHDLSLLNPTTLSQSVLEVLSSEDAILDENQCQTESTTSSGQHLSKTSIALFDSANSYTTAPTTVSSTASAEPLKYTEEQVKSFENGEQEFSGSPSLNKNFIEFLGNFKINLCDIPSHTNDSTTSSLSGKNYDASTNSSETSSLANDSEVDIEYLSDEDIIDIITEIPLIFESELTKAESEFSESISDDRSLKQEDREGQCDKPHFSKQRCKTTHKYREKNRRRQLSHSIRVLKSRCPTIASSGAVPKHVVLKEAINFVKDLEFEEQCLRKKKISLQARQNVLKKRLELLWQEKNGPNTKARITRIDLKRNLLFWKIDSCEADETDHQFST